MRRNVVAGIFKGNKYLVVIACLSFIVTAITGVYSESNNYRMLFFLPATFLVLQILFWKSLVSLKQYISFNIIYLQMIIRYLLMPMLISFGDVFTTGLNSGNTDKAIFIMDYEMLFVFIGFYMAERWINKKKFQTVKRRKVFKLSLFKINILLIGILVACSIYLVINPDFFSKTSFVWNLSDYVNDQDAKDLADKANSLVGLVFFRYRILILLVLIGVIYKTRKLEPSVKWLLSFLLVIINSTIIIGTSRLSIIYITIPFILILMQLYPLQYRKILKWGLGGLGGLVLIASVYKFSTDNTNVSGVSQLIAANSINAYFSGPGNVATGVDIYEENTKIDHSLFLFNDLFQNIPGVASLTNDQYKTNELFNYKIYGGFTAHDQIVPVSVAALFHFGYSLVFLYGIIFTILSFYFEEKARQARYISSKYIYFFLCINCSLFMMLNIGSLFSNIVTQLFLTLIPFNLLQRVSNLKNTNA